MAIDFFKELSKIVYVSDRDDAYNVKVAANILKRIQVTLEGKFHRSFYYPYDIKEGETPEIIAFNYYGSPKYHWIVLLANDMVDPHWDWPMNRNQFEQYITEKYGSLSSAIATISHHETLEIRADEDGYGYSAGDILLDGGIPCNSNFTYSVTGKEFQSIDCVKTVYQYDYEENLNEKKRTIRLIDKRYLPVIVEQFKTLVKDQ